MAYKVFANGNPLLASELNTNLMQQAIAVFLDATSRDAAITAPVEGQFAYLTASDELVKYDGSAWVAGAASLPITTEGDLVIGDASGEAERLAIGSNGTVLQSNGTTASWQAIASGGTNWTQLATGSLTGASSITVSGLTTYNQYFIQMIAASSSSSNANYSVQFNSVTSGYRSSGILNYIESTYAAGNFTYNDETTHIPMCKNFGSSDVAYGSVLITGGKSGSTKYFANVGSGNSSTETRQYHGQGMNDDTGAITSIKLISSAGNFDAGTYYIYGTD